MLLCYQGDDEMEVESGESDSEEESDEEEEKEFQRMAPVSHRQLQVRELVLYIVPMLFS